MVLHKFIPTCRESWADHSQEGRGSNTHWCIPLFTWPPPPPPLWHLSCRPLPPPQGVSSGRQRHHITTTRRPIKVDVQYHSIPNLSKGSKINLPGHPLPLSYLGPDPSSNVAFVFGLPTGCLSVWCLQASIQPLL